MAIAKEYWQIQGPPGQTGSNGTDGARGISAFCITTAQFRVPASGASVTAAVGNHLGITWADWTVPFAIGQAVYVEGGGYFEVTARPSSTQVTLKNLGYTGNQPAATIVAANKRVSPAGIQGA
jgi:hypothetical protein